MAGPPFRAPRVWVITDGNSINNYPDATNCYPTQLFATYPGKNLAISGLGWGQLDETVSLGAPFSLRVAPYLKGGERTAYLMVGGIQDYQLGATGAQAYTRWCDQADLVRAVTPTAIVIASTTTPATAVTGSPETERVAGNALIMADASNKFDAQVDLAALYPDPTDTLYYTTGLHPTTLMATGIAAAMGAALAGVL